MIRCGVVEAKLCCRRGDYKAAARHAREALATVASTEWAVLHAETELTAGQVVLEGGDVAEAVPLLQQARARFERKGDVAGVARAAALLNAATPAGSR